MGQWKLQGRGVPVTSEPHIQEAGGQSCLLSGVFRVVAEFIFWRQKGGVGEKGNDTTQTWASPGRVFLLYQSLLCQGF